MCLCQLRVTLASVKAVAVSLDFRLMLRHGKFAIIIIFFLAGMFFSENCLLCLLRRGQ